MDAEQRLDALAAVPLFSQVGRKDLERLASSVTERHFSSGSDILKEGEVGVAMFVVVSGNVEAVKNEGGSEVHLADIGPGEAFGDMALFEHFPRSATIRAKSDVECLAITEWDMHAELRTEPAIAVQMIRDLVRRLRVTSAELAECRGETPDVTT